VTKKRILNLRKDIIEKKKEEYKKLKELTAEKLPKSKERESIANSINLLRKSKKSEESNSLRASKLSENKERDHPKIELILSHDEKKKITY